MNPTIRSIIQKRFRLDRYGYGLPQDVALDLHVLKKRDGIKEVFWGRPEQLTLPPANLISGEPGADPYSRYLQKVSYVEFPSPSIVEVDDCWLYGDALLFSTPCHTQTIVVNARHKEKALRRISKKALKRYDTEELSQPIFLAFDNWANCFYHWLIDCLPRMLAVADRVRQGDGLLLLPPDINGWMREAMEIVGLADLPTLQAKKNVRYTVSKLYCPLNMNKRPTCSPFSLKLLRDNLRKQPAPNDGSANKRLFVSRKKASRMLVNEDELVQKLKPLGFVPIFAEDYNFEEKHQLFSQAEYVIAPHGSGVTNILFCDPGTTVIEIMQENYFDEAFYAMAYQLEHSYYYSMSHINANGQPEVDIADFVKNLKDLLSKNE